MFAAECCEFIDKGEDILESKLYCLQRLNAKNIEWDMIETLEVYLLDAALSVTTTSEIMYLHKNTIKYRLKVIADLLGFRPSKMPDGIPLYQAAAINRLLK